jgi:hypothetical protein
MSWLFAWIFWTGVSIGSLSWLLIHHLTLGRWGEAWRPVAGAAARALPFMLVATTVWAARFRISFLEPLPGSSPGPVCSLSGVGAHRVCAPDLDRFRLLLSQPGRRQGAAAAGLLSVLLLGSLLAFDLVMSLDPHFYSSLLACWCCWVGRCRGWPC